MDVDATKEKIATHNLEAVKAATSILQACPKKEKFTKGLMKKSFSVDCCAKEKCSHRICTGIATGVARPRATFAKEAPVDQ